MVMHITLFLALYYQTSYFKKIFPNIFEHYQTKSNIFLKLVFYFSADALEKKAAELAREQRFLKLKGIVTEDKLKEREEARMRKEEVESKIQQVEKLIEKKENELRGLEKEVEELESELMEGVVRMERGMISKKKRVEAENKQKEGEMKKLDLEILIGETKEDMERMGKRREELVSERVIVYEYVKRYEEEEEERQCDSEVRISQTLPNIFEQYRTILNFFFLCK